MSSRMFLNVRERQGLAYYISTSTDDYTDTGTISTNAGVSLDGIDKAITAVIEEYKKVSDEPVSEAELKKSKEFLKGKLVLRLEDSEEFAHMVGKLDLLYGKGKSLDEVMAEIDAVKSEDLQRVARELFVEDKMYLAVIGPYDDDERFNKLMKFA